MGETLGARRRRLFGQARDHAIGLAQIDRQHGLVEDVRLFCSLTRLATAAAGRISGSRMSTPFVIFKFHRRPETHEDSLQELSDVTRYLKLYEGVGIDGKQATAENILRVVGKRVAITPQTKILEVGTGTGWFPLYCQRRTRLQRASKISPRLVTYAAQLAQANGLQCNVEAEKYRAR